MRQALSPALLLILAFSPHPEPGVFSYNFASGSPRPTDKYTRERGYGFDRGTQPSLITGGVASDKPFFFSVAVPKGNYRVTAILGDPNAGCITSIGVESRKPAIERATTEPGRTRAVSFVTNVHDSHTLTLEFGNSRPCLDALEIRPITGQ